MGTYLQQYGAGDERRIRNRRIIVWSVIGAVVAVLLGYLVFHNFREKQVVKQFLADINAHNYQAAYHEFGCTPEHPCPNYAFNRFMDDWGPASKASSSWKVASTDSCKSFLTVNVEAQGAELQSLAVQRSDFSLGYAPAPECQERKWRWKQFFQRLTGHETK
jgi:hypothetical protein